MSENICLFDMDDTLVDFQGQMRKALVKMSSPHESFPSFIDPPEWLRERIDTVMRQFGWWKSLPPLKAGFDIMRLASHLGYDIHILTKGPSKSVHSWSEKVEWCKQYIPEEINHKITITEDKGLVYGKVLVDDWIPYALSWLKHRPRGLVIMPAHDHNELFEHPNVIRYTGENIDEIAEALDRVKYRKPGEDVLKQLLGKS